MGYVYRVSQKKRNGRFLGLCSIQTVILLTLIDRPSSLLLKFSKNIKFGKELFILWVISYARSFLSFAITVTLSLFDGPPNSESVDFSGFYSDQHGIFLPIRFREYFIHYNDTKIIQIGWKLFILWVISCGM